MESKPVRSLVKAVIWFLIGLIILLGITRSYKISLSYLVIRIILYYVYERVWKKITWGKRYGKHRKK